MKLQLPLMVTKLILMFRNAVNLIVGGLPTQGGVRPQFLLVMIVVNIQTDRRGFLLNSLSSGSFCSVFGNE